MDTGTDTAEFAKVHPNKEGFTDDQFVIDKSPVTRIGAVVAVVAHREITAFGNFTNKAIAVFCVLTIFQTARFKRVIAFRHYFGGVFVQYGNGYGRLTGFFDHIKVFAVQGRLKNAQAYES